MFRCSHCDWNGKTAVNEDGNQDICPRCESKVFIQEDENVRDQ